MGHMHPSRKRGNYNKSPQSQQCYPWERWARIVERSKEEEHTHTHTHTHIVAQHFEFIILVLGIANMKVNKLCSQVELLRSRHVLSHNTPTHLLLSIFQ